MHACLRLRAFSLQAAQIYKWDPCQAQAWAPPYTHARAGPLCVGARRPSCPHCDMTVAKTAPPSPQPLQPWLHGKGSGPHSGSTMTAHAASPTNPPGLGAARGPYGHLLSACEAAASDGMKLPEGGGPPAAARAPATAKLLLSQGQPLALDGTSGVGGWGVPRPRSRAAQARAAPAWFLSAGASRACLRPNPRPGCWLLWWLR